jgi:hypothetical protein
MASNHETCHYQHQDSTVCTCQPWLPPRTSILHDPLQCTTILHLRSTSPSTPRSGVHDLFTLWCSQVWCISSHQHIHHMPNYTAEAQRKLCASAPVHQQNLIWRYSTQLRPLCQWQLSPSHLPAYDSSNSRHNTSLVHS